jgi:hypothetical protein
MDNDGLTNFEEIVLGTNPRNHDTDNDSFSDGLEQSFNQLFGSPFNYYDNVFTRIITIFFLLIVTTILSLVIFSLSKQQYHRYQINKINQVNEAKTKLVDLQGQLADINKSLETMESRISEIKTNDQFNKYQLELDSYTGPYRDLELQLNKYSKFKKDIKLKELFEKLSDEQTRFRMNYSKQKTSLNYLYNSIRQKTSSHPISSEESFCFYCGAIIDGNSQKCNYCMQDVNNCQICKKNIQFAEEIGSCLYCNHIFHFSHLAETVKIMGKCPVCREKLIVEEIINSLPFKNKKV